MPTQQGIVGGYPYYPHGAEHESGGGDEINAIDLLDGAIETTTKAKGTLTANQLDIPNTTYTKVLFDAEDYDLGGDFRADGVNSDFTCPVTGYYLIHGMINWVNIVADKIYRANIAINNIIISSGLIQSSVNDNVSSYITDILHLNINDVVDLRGYHNAGVGTVDIDASFAGYTYLLIHLLSQD